MEIDYANPTQEQINDAAQVALLVGAFISICTYLDCDEILPAELDAVAPIIGQAVSLLTEQEKEIGIAVNDLAIDQKYVLTESGLAIAVGFATKLIARRGESQGESRCQG